MALLVPAVSTAAAGGPFTEESTRLPISRIPEGAQCEVQSPSCLDFVFVPKDEEAGAYFS